MAAGQGSGAQCQDQGPGIRERVRECCSMGDEAHQEYTGISRLIRARDQRESAAARVTRHTRDTPGSPDLSGPGIRDRECSSTGDEAHQGYTGISKLIRARDHRESAAEHQTTTHLLDTRR